MKNLYSNFIGLDIHYCMLPIPTHITQTTKLALPSTIQCNPISLLDKLIPYVYEIGMSIEEQVGVDANREQKLGSAPTNVVQHTNLFLLVLVTKSSTCRHLCILVTCSLRMRL